jgi:hypothetical protein
MEKYRKFRAGMFVRKTAAELEVSATTVQKLGTAA